MLRTLLAAVIGFLPLVPEIVRAYGLDSIPWIASAAALCAATARVLVIPGVVAWTEKFVPWLAPREYAGLHRKEKLDGDNDIDVDAGANGGDE